MNKSTINLPKEIPIFPLSNFIIFPKTSVPLNIFEPRYINMIDDAMKGNRMIGMIQPKSFNQKIPDLYKIGCVGKITSFNETEDGRYLIVLAGLSRFKITEELKTQKLYRLCKVDFKDFSYDLEEKDEEIKFSDLEFIFKNLKSLFNKQGYIIDWKELEKKSLNQTINALAMASPFSLEEKQILLETNDLSDRKQKLEQILSTYNFDNFNNKTIQ
jgi:Lon protease-like protein